ncbi:UNVERIFIED_ORG: ppGpp synthetase/RelA/SpoT-type nucleotidyltransferase [Rhizobium nepotum]|jgi:ppGpp synthetase/RelA/SpoT-type nucleotidyltranferase|nr:ppGpp synthetase/RelA/SpoT-type nucleotidyltransferase [Rhizobium nepotum]
MTEFEQYYREREALLHQTATSVKTLLSSLLDVDNHEYLSITYRVKELKSCLDKISRKKYRDPLQSMTDLVGIRVIVYFEHQIKDIEKLLRDNIEVDENNSHDKNTELGNDRIGYRSLHLTGRINSHRAQLKEYKNIADQRFEIQIRTVLQHAWAELAHDRAYKLSGGLPQKIQREVNLYAGLLEIADKSFSDIVRKVELYKEELLHTDISQESVNALSLNKFLEDVAEKNHIKLNKRLSIDEVVTNEALNFGFQNISDIEQLITKEFLDAERKYENSETSIGLIRNIMLWHDPERYFRDCWDENWNGISPSSFRLFSQRHDKFDNLLDQFGVEVLAGDDDDEQMALVDAGD